MDGQPPVALDFHAVFALVPTPLMVVDRALTIVYANTAYLRTTMRRLSDIQGRHVFDAFPETPERTAPFRDALERAVAGEANVLSTEPFAVPAPLEPGGMREIIWACSHTPIPAADGSIAFVLQNAVDITARYESDRRSAMLLDELDHRVRNLLTSVRAVAQQSLVASKSMSEAREDFLSRLEAMAVVHELIVGTSWSGAELATLLGRALAPFGHGRSCSVFDLDGPPVPLSVRQAQNLAMAVHELATNAAKYGALSQPGGAVRVAWSHEPATGAFALRWEESGGPAVSPPVRRGFGTTMLTVVLARDIGGTITLDYPPDGLVCRMEGRIGGSDATADGSRQSML